MSALFNQTNITPGTAFATGGTTSNLAETVVVGTAPLGLSVNNAQYLSQSNILASQNTSTSNTSAIFQPFGASVFFASGLVGSNYTTQQYCVYDSNTINYGSGTPGGDTNLVLTISSNLGTTQSAFLLNSISSIRIDNSVPQINMAALASTLAVVYPGCVG